MKRSIALILLITILLSTFSLTSCGSGAQNLGKRLEEMGFVENPDDADEQAKTAFGLLVKGLDQNILYMTLLSRGCKPRLWQKEEDFVVVFECRNIETIMMIKCGTPKPTYDPSAISELKKAGRLYSKCYILSAPDYVYNEIAKMNGFN